jgi:aminoacyl tRNA synthase complex-interacting multifunctional protein 1
MLMKSTFLIGNDLTAADALVFSLLHSRIRALIPSNQRKYFRVLRWFLQIQNELTKNLTSIFVPVAFDLKALESSAVVPEKSMEKLSLEEAKERKKQIKAKKSEAAPAPVAAVDVPVIGRVDLRVGKIVEIEKHPNADRLYIEKVDFGETELRTVVSGLVEHVPIEDLKDRMCMFICNLKPASICKVQSTAMLLVAKNETQGLEPLIIPVGARPGDRICVSGVEAHPDAVIKPAKEPQTSVWDDVRKDLSVDAEGFAKYKDQILQVIGISEPIHSSKISTGLIG